MLLYTQDMANLKGRKTLSSHIKMEVLSRDGFSCVDCGTPVFALINKSRQGTGDMQAEIDHIVPFSLGGSNESSNLQTLCSPCNKKKSDSYPKDSYATKDVVIAQSRSLLDSPLDAINTLPELYAPLGGDMYQSFVRFYVSVSDTTFKADTIIWFGMPYELVEEFLKTYSCTKAEILEMMGKPEFYTDCQTELELKEQIIGIRHSNTLIRQGNNLNAVAMLRNNKAKDTSPTINIQINQAVLDRVKKYEN